MKLPVIIFTLMAITGVSGCSSDAANMNIEPPTETAMTDDKPSNSVTQTDKIEVLSPMIGSGQDSVTFAADKCVIRADFSSFASGIDRDAEARLIAFIEKTEAIPYAAKQGYGKEGEVAYCIDVIRDVNSVRVLKNMRKAVGETDKGAVNIRMIADY